MEVIIRGEAKEIAALVVAIQERQWSQEELESELTAIFNKIGEAHKDLQYT